MVATGGMAIASRDGEAIGPATLPKIRALGLVDYLACYTNMRAFAAARDSTTDDELWIVEHAPVYTVGIAGRAEHFPRTSTIPVVRVDRGGQITYHGPGQAIIYCLVNLARRRINVTQMVRLLEQAVIDTLTIHGVTAERRSGAPGVYVAGAKIAALGLRIRGGSCYHGIALNVTNDLTPFDVIDPCGYPGLTVTRTADLGITLAALDLGERIAHRIARQLGEPRGIER